MHPRAPPQQLKSLRWPSQLASGRPKDEEFPLAIGRQDLGVHLPAPNQTLPASFLASLHRRRAALCEVTMVPQTLANWDAYAMQDAAVRAALGVAPAPPPSSRAAPTAPARPAPAPGADGAAAYSPQEMRRFLRHAQHYFLSVDPKQPFSVPRATWQPPPPPG